MLWVLSQHAFLFFCNYTLGTATLLFVVWIMFNWEEFQNVFLSVIKNG